MNNWDITFTDKEREELEGQKKGKMVVGGIVTKEEYEQALEEMYNDIYFGFWR